VADGREEVVSRGDDRIGVRSLIHEVRVCGFSFVREKDLEPPAALHAFALQHRVGFGALARQNDIGLAALPLGRWVRYGRRLFAIRLIASRLQHFIGTLAGDLHHRVRSSFDLALLFFGRPVGPLPLDSQALVRLLATRLTGGVRILMAHLVFSSIAAEGCTKGPA
jgi:hypothetical protein